MTGKFFYCGLSIRQTNGGVRWIGLYNAASLSVLLSSPNILYRPGDTFDSRLMLETGLPARGTSKARNGYRAGMTLTGIAPSIAFLSGGQWLRLLGIGSTRRSA